MFIEVTHVEGLTKMYINVNEIVAVSTMWDKEVEVTIIRTDIETEEILETYEEVKLLIASAQWNFQNLNT